MSKPTPYFERLAERGVKTKFTHPAEYRAYLDRRLPELQALEEISRDYLPTSDFEREGEDACDLCHDMGCVVCGNA